jgi:hypothetical protein
LEVHLDEGHKVFQLKKCKTNREGRQTGGAPNGHYIDREGRLNGHYKARRED